MKRRGKETGFWLGSLLLMGVSTLLSAQVSVSPASAVPEAFATTSPASRGVIGSDSGKTTTISSTDATTDLPDAPSAVARNLDQDPATASAVQQPPPPKLRAPVNTTVGPTFLMANGLLLGSTILNVEMISRCRPSACQSVPDAIRHRGDLYGIGIPSSLAVSYISYRLKQSGTRMWILPIAVLTAGNIIYAAHSAQFSNPSSVASPAPRRR